MTGTILLFAAYPLIFLADLSQRVLRVPSSRQGIVDFFNGSQTIEQRVLIIILAVAVAPIVEEFVFRFFFYGVLKRYFGRSGSAREFRPLCRRARACAGRAPLFSRGLLLSRL